MSSPVRPCRLSRLAGSGGTDHDRAAAAEDGARAGRLPLAVRAHWQAS